MRVVVIKHHDIDTAAFIAEAFEARGDQLQVHLVPDDGPFPALDGVGHIVVLGAANSVNEKGPGFAWIAAELAWLREADEAGVPVLGICFGAQALCATFGGRVEAMPRHEIGWRQIELTEGSPLEPGPWLEFHGDRCLLPPQARVLARTDMAVQAFTIGPHFGVQFHPEVDGPELKRWIDALGVRDLHQEGVDPDQFLADTILQEPAARDRAARLVATALDLAQSAS
jgi:GMP synthase-like glutamine amidotransferase